MIYLPGIQEFRLEILEAVLIVGSTAGEGAAEKLQPEDGKDNDTVNPVY